MKANIKITSNAVHIFVVSLFALGVFFLSSCSSNEKKIRTRPWQSPIKVEKQEPDGDDIPVIGESTRRSSGSTISSSWTPPDEKVYQIGVASWYGPDFNGRRTANGEIYDMEKLTAAHQQLPFHTLVEVENIDNHKRVVVRINDRGPFVNQRIIDLSKKAARRIGMLETGTAPVHIRIIKPSTTASDFDYSKAPAGSIPQTTTGIPVNDDTVNVKPLERETITSTPAPPKPRLTESTTNTNTELPASTSDSVDQKPETIRLKPDSEVKPKPPEPMRPETANEVSPTQNGRFFVQVGAFSSHKNATRQIKNILKGLPESTFKVIEEGGLFKVISGRFQFRSAAEQLRNRLRDYHFKSFIKELPPNGHY